MLGEITHTKQINSHFFTKKINYSAMGNKNKNNGIDKEIIRTDQEITKK